MKSTRIAFAAMIAAMIVIGIAMTFADPTIPERVTERAEAQPMLPTTAPTIAAPAAPTAPATIGTMILSAERDGRWELYAARPDGQWVQITRDYSPARAPALSPDGKQVAFQSHKDGNWELYRLQLDSGQVTRLTNQLAYDGAPSWSPDGTHIAFESYRAGDLDIWVMNADGSGLVNLTPDEPNYDYGPAWSPRGDLIAYTSWATGHKQIFLSSPDGKKQLNLSQNVFDEEQPAWSPDGKQLAFVSNREGCEEVTNAIKLNGCQRHEVYIADFDGTRLINRRQLTFDGSASAPAWSPDGAAIAYVAPRPGQQKLFVVPAKGGMPSALDLGSLWAETASWGNVGVVASVPAANNPPLYVEKPVAAAANQGHPYAMIPLKDVYLAPSWGQLSSRVSNSFLALRARVRQESGIDFLGVLSDMTRDIAYKCGVSCDNLSWHKSGRAVDTRLELTDRSGRNLMETVREDQLGETYWRMYLRTSAQDGTMGEPLKDAPWDWSYHSRAEVAPDQGGVEEALPPRGYYVDFTSLARTYGWERISSHDDPEFDWRSNRLATEYWHYQKTDGMKWYDAVAELYSPSDLAENFGWNHVVKDWQVDEMRLYFKRIPPPPNAWKWYALIP